MQKPFIKVQIKGMYSAKATVASGVRARDVIDDKWLTFIAFSREMKTQVLDFIAANPDANIKLSIVDEPKEGEWYEED